MTLQEILDKNNGNYTLAAKEADLPVSTFRDRLKRETPVIGGIPLTGEVLKKRPASPSRALIMTLPKDRGYTEEELAEHWNLSPVTVLLQARRLRAIRYVVQDGEVLRLICHPDT